MERLKLFIPLIVFVLLAGLFWVGLGLDPSEMPSAKVGDPVPEFELPTVKDEQRLVTQEVFKGQVSLLNVWGTWCAACRVEHPFLVELAERGVPIYGVNYKDDTSLARKWLEQLEDPYVLSVVDADGRLGVKLGVFGAPETYLVDQEGIVRHRHVGVVDEKVWNRDFVPLIESLGGNVGAAKL